VPTGTGGAGNAGRGGQGRGGQGRGGQGAATPGAATTQTLEARAKRPIPAAVPAMYKDRLASSSPAFAIVGATIHTVTKGEIPNGTVVFKNGKITAVGAGVSTAGATIVDGKGKHVYPGMIEAISVVGITEVGQGASGTVDTTEVGQLNPNANPALAVNPES